MYLIISPIIFDLLIVVCSNNEYVNKPIFDGVKKKILSQNVRDAYNR